jgi:hypothetical protein
MEFTFQFFADEDDVFHGHRVAEFKALIFVWVVRLEDARGDSMIRGTMLRNSI